MRAATTLFFTSDAAGLSTLPYEREVYDGTIGKIIVWVEISSLSNTVDTPVYMFYGNSAISADQSSGPVTWEGYDGHFKGVWHLPNGTTLRMLPTP